MTTIVGVVCPVCGGEVFQLLEREARLSSKTTVAVKVCRRCANKIDTENADEVEKESLRYMNKEQRKLALQRLSREWAQNLNRRAVVVYFDPGTHPHFCNTHSQYKVKGVAQRIGYGRKYGQVKVVLDKEEEKRVVETYSDLQIDRHEFLHFSVEVPWGLYVKKEKNGTWSTEINWGDRQCLVAVE